MKQYKLFLSCLFLIFIMGTFTALAQQTSPDQEKDIDLKKIDNTTRSLYILPEAFIFNDLLTVSFEDSGIYDMYIENEIGEIVYYSTFPADGMPYLYDLSAIREEDCVYTLIFEGSSGTFEGNF